MNQGYASFANWKEDMDRVNAHPHDRQLLQYVIKRVEITEPRIKQEIQDYLSSVALEKNPWPLFERIAKENKTHMLMVNTPEDPWFRA